jgi:DNA-binding GntR family transcriptional regulator
MFGGPPLPFSDPILRTALHDEVLRKLSVMILRGDLAPGSHVQEKALCDRLQISRTPLREALKVLASSGLVELRPNRGALIAPLRATEMAETFDVLSILERRAGELAATRLRVKDIRAIGGLHETMLGYGPIAHSENRLRVDLQIHRMIVEASGNGTLAAVHATLAIKVERARYLAAISPERVRRSMEEHAVILEAVRARDPARLAEALYTHCLDTRDAVVAAVSAHFAEAARPKQARPPQATQVENMANLPVTTRIQIELLKEAEA